MKIYQLKLNGSIITDDLLSFGQALRTIRFWKDLGYQKIEIIDTTLEMK